MGRQVGAGPRRPQLQPLPVDSGGDKLDGIGVSPFHDAASMFGPEVQTALDTALAGMKDGSVKTCPDTGCGVYKP